VSAVRATGRARDAAAVDEHLLQVEELRVVYRTTHGDARSVDGASVAVRPGEIFGIAGESGCGKSTLVEAVLRLIKPPGSIAGGRVLYRGSDLVRLSTEAMRRVRWKEISYVPQGSMNSLNPVLRVEEQMRDAIHAHERVSRAQARERALAALSRVGLPGEVLRMYPHQLSGGMQQRTIIATATLLDPDLVVADEPITALDVVAQKGVLQSLMRLRDERGTAVLIVAHDMAAHAEVSDRVAIMYAGVVVELGEVEEIFLAPRHPYTQLLIASVPSVERDDVTGIPGIAPNALDWPSGCRFHSRCPVAEARCESEVPALRTLAGGHRVACHLVGDDGQAPSAVAALEAIAAAGPGGRRRGPRKAKTVTTAAPGTAS
jgi:peptide/nickel transport system ATP-binding protein